LDRGWEQWLLRGKVIVIAIVTLAFIAAVTDGCKRHRYDGGRDILNCVRCTVSANKLRARHIHETHSKLCAALQIKES
jgi:hypothetical protein